MHETLTRVHRILMERIQKAALAGKTEEVLLHTSMLQKTKGLQIEFGKLQQEINKLVQLVEKGEVNMISSVSRDLVDTQAPSEPNRMATGRVQGKRARDYFLGRAADKGVYLTRKGTTGYQTSSGKKIALLYSKDHGGTWFFGIKDQPLAAVVFLCGTSSPKEFRSFVLPGEEYEKRRLYFSRSGEELKFNLREDDAGNIELQLGNKQLDMYMTKFEDDLSQL